MPVQRFVVVLIALLLGAAIVRNSAFAELSRTNPNLAERLWKDHPAVEMSRGMIEIAEATREGRPIPPANFARIEDGARKAPLAPEPFLVRGVQAQLSGDFDGARTSFLAAEKRDPRSRPAHYFLAEQYFRLGDVRSGLAQTAMLLNVSPGSVATAAPFLAQYARQPSHWPGLRDIFRKNPALEGAALAILSADAANATAVLALASPGRLNAGSAWLPVLLNSIVAAGEYQKARAVWASASHLPATKQALLFDAGFAEPKPPPPFNWALTSSSVGLSERQPGGRLHVMFYGTDDGALARQLLVLPQGSYGLRLRLATGAAHAEALTWSVRCANAQNPLAEARLDLVAARGLGVNVPGNCPAQWLELTGRASEIPQQSDVTILGLTLGTEAARG